MPLLPAFRASTPPWPTCCAGWPSPGRPRAGDGDERGRLLSELDEVTRWLAARAADAPENFLHLLRLLEAERAWAVGDFRAPCSPSTPPGARSRQRQRPWHRALIAERAARFYLAHGIEHAGYDLLAQARREVPRLGRDGEGRPARLGLPDPAATMPRGAGGREAGDRPIAAPPSRPGRSTCSASCPASQALSSETSIERLHARVVEVLSAMTGATGVHLLLWSDDRQRLAAADPADAADPGGTGRRAVPMSVLRYVQRTREPLVVADATGDDRFARDPYFADVGCCSLLAVPILSRGTLRAVLLLENRLIRGAFTAERLDSVKLIAGQLAVSLERPPGGPRLLNSSR